MTSSFTSHNSSTEFVSWPTVWVVRCRSALRTFPGLLKWRTFLRHKFNNFDPFSSRRQCWLKTWLRTGLPVDFLLSATFLCISVTHGNRPGWRYRIPPIQRYKYTLHSRITTQLQPCFFKHNAAAFNFACVKKHTHSSGYLVTPGQNWLDRKVLMNVWQCRRDENIHFPYFMSLCIHTHFMMIILLDTSQEKSRSCLRSLCKMWM